MGRVRYWGTAPWFSAIFTKPDNLMTSRGWSNPIVFLYVGFVACYVSDVLCLRVGACLSLVCCLIIRGSTSGFLLLRDFSSVVSQPRGLRVTKRCFCRVLISDLSKTLFLICLFPMLIH